ncbi:MAG: DUF1461 domain-containing protein [Clostridiales bacterium]|jgi:integral membrane protein (TIGR01906 family)|nr:DUF1461 domain-containing protein [Clostridiales bacterium]
MKKRVKISLTIAGIISAISLIGLILLIGAHLPSFGMWFYYWQYGANDTYAQVAMNPEDLHEVTRHMIDYMRGNTPYLQIYTHVAGEFRPFFSEIEIRHMVDVRDLAVFSIFLRNLFAILFVISTAPFIASRKIFPGAWQILAKCWKWGAIGTVGATALLALIISLDWDRAWYIFHEIIFTNELFFGNRYWLLNPNVDLLINIVPYPFFIALTAFMGIFFASGLILVFVAAIFLARRVRGDNPHNP